MGEYVTEEKWVFFFHSDDDDYNISVLKGIDAMDCHEIDSMKKYCRESTVFRRENWVSPVAEFLNRLGWINTNRRPSSIGVLL